MEAILPIGSDIAKMEGTLQNWKQSCQLEEMLQNWKRHRIIGSNAAKMEEIL